MKCCKDCRQIYCCADCVKNPSVDKPSWAADVFEPCNVDCDICEDYDMGVLFCSGFVSVGDVKARFKKLLTDGPVY